jgi:hypothetical protein
MSTSSFGTRGTINRPSSVLNLFSLSAFPAVLLFGLIVALTGGVEASAVAETLPASTVSISQTIPAETSTASYIHVAVDKGGALRNN